VFGPEDFSVTATDYKTQDLIDKYGAEIFGLTEENKQELTTRYVFPIVVEEVKKEIFG
jgi:hypothetical protein